MGVSRGGLSPRAAELMEVVVVLVVVVPGQLWGELSTGGERFKSY